MRPPPGGVTKAVGHNGRPSILRSAKYLSTLRPSPWTRGQSRPLLCYPVQQCWTTNSQASSPITINSHLAKPLSIDLIIYVYLIFSSHRDSDPLTSAGLTPQHFLELVSFIGRENSAILNTPSTGVATTVRGLTAVLKKHFSIFLLNSFRLDYDRGENPPGPLERYMTL